MLTVKSSTKAQRRTSETQFEGMFVDALKRQGIYSRHMADRMAGVPDRYVGGGTWVELKSLVSGKQWVRAGEGLSVPQKRTMSELADAGDNVHYLALILLPSGKKVMILESVTEALDDRITYGITDLEGAKLTTDNLMIRPYTQEGFDQIINRIVPF